MKKVWINSLFSLENVSDVYYINSKLQIINSETGKIKSVWITNNGYPSVTLATQDCRQRHVTMHKIVALAFIHNWPYKVIEHKDDNKLDYRPKNLLFSNQHNNILSAIKNGKKIVPERIFKVILINGKKYKGTMKEISKETGIARGTLYDHLYYRQKYNEDKKSKTIRRVIEII